MKVIKKFDQYMYAHPRVFTGCCIGAMISGFAMGFHGAYKLIKNTLKKKHEEE